MDVSCSGAHHDVRASPHVQHDHAHQSGVGTHVCCHPAASLSVTATVAIPWRVLQVIVFSLFAPLFYTVFFPCVPLSFHVVLFLSTYN